MSKEKCEWDYTREGGMLWRRLVVVLLRSKECGRQGREGEGGREVKMCCRYCGENTCTKLTVGIGISRVDLLARGERQRRWIVAENSLVYIKE